MNVTLTIQDITPRELSALMGALAAMPAPEPEPALQPAPAAEPEPAEDPTPRRGRPGTAMQRLLEQQAERQRKEQELAAVMVAGENGIREPLGKAIERLQEEKKHHHRQQPVAGRHDDGDIKWWPSRTDAARDLAVTPDYVSKCIKECRKLRGWMLEDDNQEKGGAR